MTGYSRIVVIGASAGGVEALLGIAPDLNESFPAPVLIVQHIGAHKSVLPRLLKAKGAGRTMFAETGMRPVPGEVYVAPPDMHMLVDAEGLQLNRGPKEHHTR